MAKETNRLLSATPAAGLDRLPQAVVTRARFCNFGNIGYSPGAYVMEGSNQILIHEHNRRPLKPGMKKLVTVKGARGRLSVWVVVNNVIMPKGKDTTHRSYFYFTRSLPYG